jgi:hypothetical protein
MWPDIIWSALKSTQRYSRWDQTIIWDHPAETHFDPSANRLTPAYYDWRGKLFTAKSAVRYPVGFHHRSKCLFAFTSANQDDPLLISNEQKLGYIDSRKQIYGPLYSRLAREQPLFQKLKDMMASGHKLLILDVDGPHQESMSYYQKNYDVSEDFIEQKSIIATKENLSILLNDPKHPYGHGYVLASILQDMDDLYQ